MIRSVIAFVCIVSVVLFNEAWELNMGMCMKLYNTDMHVADPD